MTTTGKTVADPLDTIDAHPLVARVATTHRQLRADQARLNDELVEVRKTIVAAESDAPDPLVPSRSMRQARQRAEQIGEELEEMRAALCASTEALEAARSAARAEVRPALKQRAILSLREVLEQAEQWLATQQNLQILEAQTRRLGISFGLGGCTDPFLAGRIEVIRKALARLQD
jgi:hypothetical protein